MTVYNKKKMVWMPNCLVGMDFMTLLNRRVVFKRSDKLVNVLKQTIFANKYNK